MSVKSRVDLYKRIEDLRGNPLVVYVTSRRTKASGDMACSAVPELCDQIHRLQTGVKAVDLMLVSTGGDPMVSWKIVSMLREHVSKVNVLIPSYAYSAATALALGADEIVMHPCGNLGPVDPQIDGYRKDKDGRPVPVHFGTEDMSAFLDFVKREVGIKDKASLLEAFKVITSEFGANTIGFAARSMALSQKLGKKLLQTHMGTKEAKKVNAIVDKLNKEFFNHGYPVSRTEAREIGLKVIDPDPKLQDAMWKAWTEIERDMKVRSVFNPMSAFLGKAKTTKVTSTSLKVPMFPSMIPASATSVFPLPAIPTEIVSASSKAILVLLESTRLQRMMTQEVEMSGMINANGVIRANVVGNFVGWEDSLDSAT